jgi:hypothetical protein
MAESDPPSSPNVNTFTSTPHSPTEVVKIGDELENYPDDQKEGSLAPRASNRQIPLPTRPRIGVMAKKMKKKAFPISLSPGLDLN